MYPRGSIYSVIFKRLCHLSSNVSPKDIVDLKAYSESEKSSNMSFGLTVWSSSPDISSVGVGGCSSRCLTFLALLLKDSTMILIFSLKTCSFSGPKIVDVSLMIDLLDIEDLMEISDPLDCPLYRERAKGIGLNLDTLDSKEGTFIMFMVFKWFSPDVLMEEMVGTVTESSFVIPVSSFVASR